jgi:hypothetical protein
MQDIVFNYLNRHYEIKTSDLGYDGVYRINDDINTMPPISEKKLLDELNSVFNLSKSEIKETINEWSKTTKKDVNLEFYWTPIGELLKKIIK